MQALGLLFAVIGVLILAFFLMVLAFCFWLVLGWMMGEAIDWLMSGYMSALLNQTFGVDLDGGDYGLLLGAIGGIVSLVRGIGAVQLNKKS